MIEKEEGEIFGCYINSIIEQSKRVRDEHAFVFNLESNGRHEGPMKFDIKKEKWYGAFYLFPDWNDVLFDCGYDIRIKKENFKSKSYCWQNENSRFDYRGVEKALVQNPYDGKIDWENRPTFTPKRIIVIQMN